MNIFKSLATAVGKLLPETGRASSPQPEGSVSETFRKNKGLPRGWNWNPVNALNYEASLERLSPEQLIQLAQNPPWLLQLQNPLLQAKFYRALYNKLRTLVPSHPVQKTIKACFEAKRREAGLSRSSLVELEEIRATRDLMAELPAMEFEGDSRERVQKRKQARVCLAVEIARRAENLRARGELLAACEAFQLLEETGAMTRQQRLAHAQLLWSMRDTSAAATQLYAKVLVEHGWNLPDSPVNRQIAEYVKQKMVIDHTTPSEELHERIRLIGRAILARHRVAGIDRNAGVGYLRIGKADQAITHLERALKANGRDGGWTAFYLGQAYFELKSYEKSAESFDVAATHGFSKSRIAAWQGLAWAKSRNWERAFTTFQQAEAEHGTRLDSEFFVYWGRASFMMRAVEVAEQRFRQAMERNAGDLRAPHGLAVCQEYQGQHGDALETLRRAMALENARSAPCAHLLGLLVEKDGDVEEAIRWYRKACEYHPADSVYALSLGLALDQQGSTEALSYLQQAAAAGLGGLEAWRRLALGHKKIGNTTEMRHCLDRLIAWCNQEQGIVLFHARDLATQATEAFNQRHYADAARLFEEVSKVYAGDLLVQDRLALSLLCDATVRLEAKCHPENSSGLWEQIERAHAMMPSAEADFLLAFSYFMRGRYREANQLFARLRAGQDDCQDIRFFEIVTRYFQGEQEAATELMGIGHIDRLPNLDATLPILQAQAAAQQKDLKLAGELIEKWLQSPDLVLQSGLEPTILNCFVASCLEQASPRKTRVIRILEDLNSRDAGFWKLALTLVQHHDAARKIESAELAKLAEIDAAYEEVFSAMTEQQKVLVAPHYAALLQFRLRYAIWAGNITAAMEFLDRLEQLHVPQPLPAAALRAVLNDRMAQPSHEKAYALLQQDPEAARKVWLEMHEREPNDHTTIHHLACLAWSRAHDAVLAGQYRVSLPFWREGVDWFCQLYSSEDYWQQLSEKGKSLHQSAYPFTSAAFEAWRNEAGLLLARTLLEVAAFLMVSPNKAADTRNTSNVAQEVMTVIRSSRLAETDKERLANELADRFLDKDPTQLPDFEASMRRAEQVLKADPQNFKALRFIVRAQTYHIEAALPLPDVSWKEMAKSISAATIYAVQLQQRSTVRELQGVAVTSDLALFYEAMGSAKHREANAEIDDVKASTNRNEHRTHLQRLKTCLHESTAAWTRAIELDPAVQARVADGMALHQKYCDQVDEALRAMGVY